MDDTKIEKKENIFKDLFRFGLTVLLVVIPIRMFIAQPFVVVGQSMEPTFSTNQYLIIDELSYHFKDPERDQVIVFKYPYKKDDSGKDVYYIKRIIGLPGETVEIKEGKVTIINNEHPEGFTLDEPYTNPSTNNRSFTSMTATLNKHQYFVMGDNRGNSSDSREWGPLDEKFIVGKAFIRLLPPQKLSLFPGNYTDNNQ